MRTNVKNPITLSPDLINQFYSLRPTIYAKAPGTPRLLCVRRTAVTVLQADEDENIARRIINCIAYQRKQTASRLSQIAISPQWKLVSVDGMTSLFDFALFYVIGDTDDLLNFIAKTTTNLPFFVAQTEVVRQSVRRHS